MAASRPIRCASLLLLLVFSPANHAQAQDDSLSFYRKIDRYAENHKLTRWIYEAIFVPPVSDEDPAAEETPRRRVDPNLKYKGKIIRAIQIHVLDPFGYSVDDTTQAPTIWLQRTGNSLHRRTRVNIIRNFLLVRPLTKLDPLRITESERVLRASPMVTEAVIRAVRVPGTKDSVDLIVLVHDKWTIDISAEGDLGSVSVTARDRNLLGFGQELEQRAVYANGGSRIALDGHHSIYNIKRSYITSTLSYSTAVDANHLGLAFARSFYSPLAKWAGGVSVDKAWSKDTRVDPLTGIETSHRLSPVAADTWLARSFMLGGGEALANQSSHIIVGARYAQTRYASRPTFDVDTARIYSNSSLFLISVGLSARQYYKERYLYRFGSTEDVPEGLLCTVTSGMFKQELKAPTPYLGVEISRGGNTEDFGYISLALGYGTFFHQGDAVDGTFRAELTYFTNLYSPGRWHFRQFARINSVIGFSKPVSSSLSLGGEQLYGLQSDGVSGVHKTVLNLETVAYAPYRLLGFRFAPALLMGFGNIGEEGDPLLSGRIYTVYSLGLLIRNENLLTSTFEISFAFYPYLPDGSTAILQINPPTSFSLRARDFTFSEPAVIGF